MIWQVPCSLSKSGMKNQFSACSRVLLQWPPKLRQPVRKQNRKGWGMLA